MDTLTITPLKAPVTASVRIPGSKSYTNRAFIMAALTDGTVAIKNALESDDTTAMIRCLTQLGIPVKSEGGSIEISGGVAKIADGTFDLDCDISGTTIRFLTALATVVPGVKTLYGKEGLNKRPIAELVDGLRQLGADITYINKEGFPPVRVNSRHLSPGEVSMNGDVSSQFFSALLMITPLVGGVTITVDGDQISKPYIDMTIDTMKEFGVTVHNDSYTSYTVPAGQTYSKNEYSVEADVSSASYFAAIAALTHSTITLENMNPHSMQADMRFLKILERMGAEIIPGEYSITVKGHGVKALEANMENCPDQAQTLAVLAAFAPGVTHMTGVRSLRVKETERVVAVEQELAKMGIKTESTHDTLTVYGGDPKPARIDTYGDHRMAMSFAVAGTILPGLEIKEPQVVQKTFPDFWKRLSSIGVTVA
ncbi:3-phosphoshikimate 1-carboxyvinyltransferase [Candidatus Kaiserbacteria bacterium]|nr:3-phosphoshikimate 1-carboxyvinyltransferase [Candidatus Kaiserbacteria bacterium]